MLGRPPPSVLADMIEQSVNQRVPIIVKDWSDRTPLMDVLQAEGVEIPPVAIPHGRVLDYKSARTRACGTHQPRRSQRLRPEDGVPGWAKVSCPLRLAQHAMDSQPSDAGEKFGYT